MLRCSDCPGHDLVTQTSKHVVTTSFYVDCSAGSAGWPDDLDPPLYAPEEGTMSQAKLCRKIRQAIKNHTKTTIWNLMCKGEDTAFIHDVQMDSWMKCCITGDDDDPEASCIQYYITPMAKPPAPKSRAGQSIPEAKARAALAKVSTLKASKCGRRVCGSTGEYPESICLTVPGFNPFNQTCMKEGLPGELRPMDPLFGKEDYKVFQVGMPSGPLLAALLATHQVSEEVMSKAAGRKFAKHARLSRSASEFLGQASSSGGRQLHRRSELAGKQNIFF